MQDEQTQDIPGPAGNLEAKWRAASQSRLGFLACHPHPLFQGSMDNKVITTLTRAAAELGLPTLRFNFRGVGQSTGAHDQGQGEQEDVLAALHYAQRTLGWQQVILAGFSFGAGMACLAACREPERIVQLFLLAPPVHHFDAPAQLPFGLDTFIYYGDQDEVVPVDDMAHWSALVIPTPTVRVFEGGSHFFHGKLIELKEALQSDLARAD